eukprot:gnl/Hemi2/17303_TR5757_c0_g9_i1.p1 gnl/Hemi2/17303_TR5757_c0_g9~~gnl/Hemi2/17303_TR5757_c0_g9_i1.p1  ORF type:complete len:365 (-),score=123.02 gnl/Hemi2/17303_TR5757_c0_g9_i1:303-1397(-)
MEGAVASPAAAPERNSPQNLNATYSGELGRRFPHASAGAASALDAQVKNLLRVMREKAQNNFVNLHAAFWHFDTRRRGGFTKDELIDGLRRWHVTHATEDSIDTVFYLMSEGEDKVNYSRFMVAIRDIDINSIPVENSRRLYLGKGTGKNPPCEQQSVFWSSLSVEDQQRHLRKLILDQVHSRKGNLQSLFRLFDIHRDGSLSLEEFQTCCRHFGIYVELEQLQPIMEAFTTNKDGRVSLHEFCLSLNDLHFEGDGPQKRMQPFYFSAEERRDMTLRAMVRDKILEKKQTKHKCFLGFGADSNGLVGYDELKHGLLQWGLAFSEADLNRVIKLIDPDLKGYLNYQDFAAFLSKADEEAARVYEY